MPKLAKELSALEVNRLNTAGLHAVGGVTGLYLQVDPPARSWILRIKIGNKRRDIGLGGYPSVTLAKSREKAREAREQVALGIDPIEARGAALRALKAAQSAAKTFRQCTAAYIEAHESGWRNAKHAQQWLNTLKTYAFPVLGDMLVKDIEKQQVLDVLTPIWTTKTETASRLRGRIESVLSYAIQAGYRPEGLNPARWKGGLDNLLSAPSKVSTIEHHPALPIDDIGAFMLRLRQADGMGARALEMAILTATRSGEVRGARWSEMDLDAKVWTIPASRMKAGREHRVALSSDAVALLKKLDRVEDNDTVFVAPRGGVLSDMTLTAVLRRMDLTDITVHGFRSTFRDWAGERTSHPREVIEHAMAHQLKDKAEAAYARGDLFDKRRRLMDDWAKFCAVPIVKGSTVVAMKRAAA